MRVIAGEFRGRILKSPPGDRTRPTSDRLRETLFNIIAPQIDSGTRFLDLCAGTGAIGIEAISRGAAFAGFIDKSRRACALIEQNLDLLGIPEPASDVVCASAENFLGRPVPEPWQIIFFDPPYSHDHFPVIHAIANSESILDIDNGLFIAEHHSKTVLPDACGDLRRWRIVRQGESCLSFYSFG